MSFCILINFVAGVLIRVMHLRPSYQLHCTTRFHGNRSLGTVIVVSSVTKNVIKEGGREGGRKVRERERAERWRGGERYRVSMFVCISLKVDDREERERERDG